MTHRTAPLPTTPQGPAPAPARAAAHGLSGLALRKLALAGAALWLAGSAGAQTVAVPLPGDLSAWSCLGVCGQMAAQGDISPSPLGNAQYGYVSTAFSETWGTSPLQLDSGGQGSEGETNGSRYVSAIFTAPQGGQLDMHFNYASTDGKGFDDYAWARIVNASDNSVVAWLFTARSSNSGTGNIVPGDVLDRSEFDPDEVIVNFDDFNFTSMTSDNPIDWVALGASNQTCWRDNAPGCGYTGWLHSRHSFAQAGSYRIELGVVNWGDEAYDSALAFDFAQLAPVPEAPSVWLLGCGLAALAWRRKAAAR